MPTQEERFTALEQTLAFLQRRSGVEIQDLNRNVTMLLGVASGQELDIKEIKISLVTVRDRLDVVEQRLGTIEHGLDVVEQRLGTIEHGLDAVELQYPLHSYIEGTLIDQLGRMSTIVITSGLIYPGVQIMLAFVLFLPHLVEAPVILIRLMFCSNLLQTIR